MPHKEKSAEPAGKLSVEHVFDLYIATHHRIRRVVDEAMSGCGLSITRGKALKHLRDHGPVNQRELAALFGYAPRSITDLIDGLERDGLAKRKDDPGDRRAKLVEITPAGIEDAHTAMAIRGDMIEQIFGALLPGDRAQLARLLALLQESTAGASTASRCTATPTPSLPVTEATPAVVPQLR